MVTRETKKNYHELKIRILIELKKNSRRHTIMNSVRTQTLVVNQREKSFPPVLGGGDYVIAL